MRNTARIDELIIARHKLAQVVQDILILKNYPSFAEKGLQIVFGMEKQIMSRKPKRRNPVLHAKNKHKSPRA